MDHHSALVDSIERRSYVQRARLGLSLSTLIIHEGEEKGRGEARILQVV
jgi:hypothetical protein